MRAPDVDKIRSEMNHSIEDFLELYNENLPLAFPRASTALLKEFQNTHTGLFRSTDVWSLDLHRKKVMDWLRAHPA